MISVFKGGTTPLTISVVNALPVAITNAFFTDVLPSGLSMVPGKARYLSYFCFVFVIDVVRKKAAFWRHRVVWEWETRYLVFLVVIFCVFSVFHLGHYDQSCEWSNSEQYCLLLHGTLFFFFVFV
jgi:uncharacterized repeat protein (TIGR01451 family)